MFYRPFSLSDRSAFGTRFARYRGLLPDPPGGSGGGGKEHLVSARFPSEKSLRDRENFLRSHIVSGSDAAVGSPSCCQRVSHQAYSSGDSLPGLGPKRLVASWNRSRPT